MALKLVRMMKKKLVAAGRKNKSEIEKFLEAIDVQIRMAGGVKVKRGKGFVKSWFEDGESFGQARVIRPRVGRSHLWPKSAIPVTDPNGIADLNLLKAEAESGRLNNLIYTVLRAQKKRRKKSA